MQILGFAHILPSNLLCSLLAEAGSTSIITSLPFNPIKLICLIVWVYLCLYFVQIVQFSPLVPRSYKSIAYILILFVGPILLLVLSMVDTAKKSFKGNDNIIETIKKQFQNAAATIRFGGSERKEEDFAIRLLDPSGRSIDEIYGHSNGKRPDARILDLTEQLIADALEKRASDILIDPLDESTYTIRLRIDGILKIVDELGTETSKAIVNSIKAVSNMDISEKRRPQDGAFVAKKGRMTASFRVASAGVINGEKLSIRILNQNAGTFTLSDMTLTKKQYTIIKNVISRPSGMILLCGPTGSGKTTTMYAMLNEIDQLTHNIITVEDPIEAVLPTVSQIEINPKADITFAKALRSVLRQDPDVICVGEIRDEETAEIALRASQTGHLVFATIHCNSNATALVRLLDLGISPLLLSSGLSLLSSQRLLRRLCEHCKKPAHLSNTLIQEFQKINLDYSKIFNSAGCKHCDRTGYFGRIAVCDVLEITDQLKTEIANNSELVAEMKSESKKKIKSKLRKEGLKKVASGLTSLEELKRVIG